MAVSRLQAALAAATNEVTVAAANLNFNFTLVKYEAPKEYQGLGKVLSAKRKDNAEHGSSHITARQLGALFEGVCPATPKLLEVYGTRASEIAKASKSSSERYADTFFAEYTGIDGTSIWAAATSSKCALHVHLLACMLARLWTAPEAVAIWAELVAERRKEIARKVDEEGITFSLAAAAAQEIDRPQLAAWDASARAWLLTADEVHCRQQKQLELILKNIDMPINEDTKVHSGVISAWSVALETMEKLVSGMPQEIRNGATLLGLSAWHLYPDMSVFGRKIASVKMNDSLIPGGGVLSLGLSGNPHAAGNESGVYWSLSLAHLRFYGKPVHTERTMNSSSRISPSELSLVAVAALFEEWCFNETQQELAAKAIVSMANCVEDYLRATRQGEKTDIRLFQMLREGASAFVHRSAGNEDLNRRLIQLGRRRAHKFFAEEQHTLAREKIPSFFGFLDSTFLIQSLKDCEARILFLRHKASQLSANSTHQDCFIIRYKHDAFKDMKDRWNVLKDAQLIGDPDSYHSPEHIRASKCRKQNSSSKKNKPNLQGEFPEWDDLSNAFSFATALPFRDVGNSGAEKDLHTRWFPRWRRNAQIPQGERVTLNAEKKFNAWDDCVQALSNDLEDADTLYKYVLGDASDASLYATTASGTHSFYDQALTLEDFQWCMDHKMFDPSAVLQSLTCNKHLGKDSDRLRKTLALLASAALVYDHLPDVTIDVGILGRPLIESQWARYFVLHSYPTFSAEGTVSLIAYFETGIHDVDPTKLKDVIALSYTNSLYVFSSMLQDPYESQGYELHMRRVLGNIGRPGITFLLPPQEPMIRELDPASWMVDSYRLFDGKPARSFESTSIHLSFTDYYVQMYDGSRGSHDNQVSFVESVISVRDKGQWVADIDPFPLFEFCANSRSFHVGGSYFGGSLNAVSCELEPRRGCQHSKDCKPNHDITAVDSWDEILDIPGGTFVVRTGGNWVSRLALTMVAMRQLRKASIHFAITICPSDVCWACVKSKFHDHMYIW